MQDNESHVVELNSKHAVDTQNVNTIEKENQFIKAFQSMIVDNSKQDKTN